MNGTTKDIDGRLAGAIGDGTVSCGTLLFRVIINTISGNPLVPDFLVNRIVLVTHVGTRVRSAVGKIIKTVTTAEDFHNLIGAINLYIGGWCRSSITTTIHLTDARQSATVDDNLGRPRRVRATFRLISSLITAAIYCRDIIRVGILIRFGTDVGFGRRLCGIDMHHHVALRRSVDVVATEDLSDSTTLCIISDGRACCARRCCTVQVNQHITPYIGRLTFFSQSTAKDLFTDTSTNQTNGRSMECRFLVCVSPAARIFICSSIPVAGLRVSQGATAIEILQNQTSRHVDGYALLDSTGLAATEYSTGDELFRFSFVICSRRRRIVDVYLCLSDISET